MTKAAALPITAMLTFAALAVTLSGTLAQADDKKYCNSSDWQPPFTEARISGDKGDAIPLLETFQSPKLYCEDIDGEKKCTPIQVKAGRSIILAFKNEGYACVGYDEKNSAGSFEQFNGWVKLTDLEELPSSIPSLSEWRGNWAVGDNTLYITIEGDTLQIQGYAIWRQNDGEFSGIVTPQENHIHTGPDIGDCIVDIWKIGPQLFVSDNAKCGGNNVRFNGIYRKDP